jgi:hypothetical protein
MPPIARVDGSGVFTTGVPGSPVLGTPGSPGGGGAGIMAGMGRSTGGEIANAPDATIKVNDNATKIFILASILSLSASRTATYPELEDSLHR